MPGGSRTTNLATVNATLARIEVYVDELESGHQVFGIFGPRAPPLGESLGDPYFVDGSLAASGAGTSWATAVLTIQEAVDLSSDDDVIFIAPGTYDEDTTAGGVTFGTQAGIHIIGLGPWAVKVVNSHAGATAVFTINGNNRIEITGLTIYEGTATVMGIAITTGDYLWIHHNLFRGTMENGIQLVAGWLCRIEDNWFNNMTDDAIEMTGAALFNVIKGNVIWAPGGVGININHATTINNFVVDNIINGANTTATGINVAGNYNSISGGFIGGCTTAISDSGLFNIWDVPVDVVLKGTFNRTVANGTTEITTDIDAIDLPSSGDYEIVFDLNTLVIAAEGGTFTMRLYQNIGDVTGRIVDISTFLVGTDVVHPSVSHSFEGGPTRMRVTHQVSAAVTGDRSIPYKIIQKR